MAQNDTQRDATIKKDLPVDARPQPVRVETPISDIADTLTRTQLSETEIADFISANWHKPVILLVLVLLGIWIYDAVEGNRDKVLGDGAERFSTAQEIFPNEILAPAKAGSADAEGNASQLKAFNDSLQSVTTGYSSTTYAELGKLYLAAADQLGGRSAEAKATLKELGVDRILASGDGKAKMLTRNDIVGELAALIYARALLNEKSPEARKFLETLTNRASMVCGEAALILLRTASTKEERDQARATAESVLKRRPDLRRVMSREFDQYNVESK